MEFCNTLAFIESQSKLPVGSEAQSDCPETVTAELNAAGIGVGTFFQLLPLLLELFRNEQIRELIAKILAALKPAPQ